MRLLALLLPVGALVVVGALFLALQVRDGGSGGSRPVATGPSQGGVEQSSAGGSLPRLEPGANVCQGVLHVPAPGQPQTFPAQYTKHATAHGLTIVAGPGVPSDALDQARTTVERVFAGNDLAAALIEQGAYVVIAEKDQGVLDLPEFACLNGKVDQDFFNHVCGVADRADYPVATVNEADLLGDRSGPCRGLNILYHELGHLVQNWSVAPADWFDIKQYYQQALDEGRYRGQYAATNADEYFAEATQSYFLYGDTDGSHDRAWLAQYDPRIYALLQRVYGK